MSVLRMVGWSCIAYAFMVLARIGVAFAAHVPSHDPAPSTRGTDRSFRPGHSTPKRHAAFAE